MKQVYHSNSTTNVRLRSEINKSTLPYPILASQYRVSENTIDKWKNRTEFTDKNSRPLTIKYALSGLEILIAIELRNSLHWWSLDEITEAINPLRTSTNKKCSLQNFCQRRY